MGMVRIGPPAPDMAILAIAGCEEDEDEDKDEDEVEDCFSDCKAVDVEGVTLLFIDWVVVMVLTKPLAVRLTWTPVIPKRVVCIAEMLGDVFGLLSALLVIFS